MKSNRIFLRHIVDEINFLMKETEGAEDVDPAVVVTVYRTSKIDKYWRRV